MVLRFGKKVLELYGPWHYKIRGRLSVISFDVSIAWKGDHSPSVFIYLGILCTRIAEIHWYDTRHEDHKDPADIMGQLIKEQKEDALRDYE